MAVCFSLTACNKFLDEKADRRQSVPDNLEDLELMLDNAFDLNAGSGVVNSSTDEFYLRSDDVEGLPQIYRDPYTWAPQTEAIFDWQKFYKAIFIANTVLEQLGKVDRASDPVRWDYCKGAALYFRGYNLFQLSQQYAPHYPGNENSPLGLPLRSSSDFNKVVTRSTLKETYDQMMLDIRAAMPLLPSKTYPPIRPSRWAAYAMLARLHLLLENYTQAFDYADSTLAVSDDLMDYNTIDPGPEFPIQRFNPEVIYHIMDDVALTAGYTLVRIDSVLYRSFEEGDLRKKLFFIDNHDGSFSFKGNYTFSYYLFHGLATDEIYLIKAEAAVRTGKVDEALASLNTLLQHRWAPSKFQPVNIRDQEALLVKILEERKKEMIFRGQRWSDLRRLNRDPRFQITLRRVINGQEYTLPPNDLRYTFLIPPQSINISGIPQNPR